VADILFMLGKKRVGRPTMHVVKVSDRDAGQSVTDKTADDSVKAIDRIRQMIGLTSVKRHLEQNICYVKMMDARRQAGLPCGNRLMHVIMTGSPGTGKTTVARLLGKAYKEMNILSSGHTVECNRSTLVQDHIGGTEKATKEKIEEAMGGVLFIDEAYSLLSGSQLSNDFGVRIIDTLMTVLSDPESDILVVLAGYEDEMQKLLKSNPGLASRFPVRLHFPDYSVDELMLMADDWFKDNGYQTDAKVRQRIRDVVAGAAACQSFGAGRFIHTLIQNTILPNMATRLFAKGVFGKMDSSVLSQILPQDVPAPEDVVTRLKGSEKKVRAIGFR
jgi:stage V sporulation protein K